MTYVPQATPEELSEASKAASSAFKTWKKSSILSRQRIMFELQALIRQNMVFLNQSMIHFLHFHIKKGCHCFLDRYRTRKDIC